MKPFPSGIPSSYFSPKNWLSYMVGFLQVLIALGIIALFFSPLLWAEEADTEEADKKETPKKFTVSSSAFKDGEAIPKEYTCDGRNIVPPLMVYNIPPKTKSLALIIDDPDAPTRNWTHLAFWNVAPKPFVVPEGKLPSLVPMASNDFGQIGYGGPCPSIKKSENGRINKKTDAHHYHFRVFALDTVINLPRASKRLDLDRMMSGHVIEKADLVGTYQREASTKPAND
ncbi:MAG: YbhB/YbcL family Raf kinase inhibitor-like protein [Vampirovibrionales bacterium]|nr:YbhB/YbcL family Raf kinase inhibitor-like protein [Vampirovibrionales bacterium]